MTGCGRIRVSHNLDPAEHDALDAALEHHSDERRVLVAQSSLIIATCDSRSYSLCAYEDHEIFLFELRRRNGNRANELMRGHLASVENQLRLEACPINYVDLETVFHVDV